MRARINRKNNCSTGVSATLELFKNNIIFSSTIVLALITFFGYAYSIIYQAAYLAKFNLSLKFIEVSIESIILYSLIPIFFIIYSILLYIVFHGKQLTYKINKNLYNLYSKKIGRFLFTFLYLILTALCVTSIYFIWLRKINEITFIDIFYSSILIFAILSFFAEKKLFKEKKSFLTHFIPIILIIMLSSASVGNASNPDQIIIDKNSNKYFMIMEKHDIYLVAPYVNTNALLPIYSLITKDDIEGFIFSQSNESIEIAYSNEYYKRTKIKSIKELAREGNKEELRIRPFEELKYYANENDIIYSDIVFKGYLVNLIIDDYLDNGGEKSSS